MHKFSIIIPVYNVENYLAQCIGSILNQTCKDYEIILVDDGSTDTSGAICDQYAKEYANIYAYHQINQGQSAARNFGVKKAKAEYIWFIDSDDIILRNDALEILEKEMKDYPDVIAFGWKESSTLDGFEHATKNFNFQTDKSALQNGPMYLNDTLSEKMFYYWYPCIYLFKRHYWMNKQFLFPEGRKFEDIRLTYRTVLEANSVKRIREVFYGYRIEREGSTTTNTNLRTLKDGLVVIAQNINEIVSNDAIEDELKGKLTNNFACNYFALLIASTKLSSNQQKEFRKSLKEYLWIADYATATYQNIVKKAIPIVGISGVQTLLGIRRILKYGK